MVTLCWAAKGGSGTTVIATALALSSARPSLLVDLDGEIPEILGRPAPERPGVADWIASDAPHEHLEDLLIDVGNNAWVLPWRGRFETASSLQPEQPEDPATVRRWQEFSQWLAAWALARNGDVTIDAGTGEPNTVLFSEADRTLLVTRPCYLALRRAARSSVRPSGVVLIAEPGHAFTKRDIEHSLSAPIEATVSLDPAIARAVDSGLLATRLPRVLFRELRRVTV